MRKVTYLFTMLLSLITICVASVFSLHIVTYAPAYIDELDNLSEVEKENYYRTSEYDPYEYYNFAGEKCYLNNYEDLYKNNENNTFYQTFQRGYDDLYHLLVLPISFLDSPKDESLEHKRTNIHNAFFGSTEKNISYSVSEYYNISSYGHVKMTGEVAPFFEIDKTFAEIKTYNSTASNVSKYLCDLAIKNYYSTLKEDTPEAHYDFNHDDYIDGVYVIYDYPSGSTKELEWAYVDDCPINIRTKINNEAVVLNSGIPYFKLYAWSSYYFLEPSLYNEVNNHVYIHEVGHLFGLKDYYNPNNGIQPLGHIDMMDSNIGDHNPYSKYCMSWASPYVIKDKGEITIKPFATSGEFILVPSQNYTGNPFGEYLLIEFYAPLGVNKYDTRLNFIYGENKNRGQMLKEYGIRVYHVDSSLGYFERRNNDNLITYADNPNLENTLDEYREKVISEKGNKSWAIKIVSTNKTPNNRPLIKAIERPGVDLVYGQNLAYSDDSLFKEGDIFKTLNLEQYKFYTNEKIPFNFEITSLNFEGATINFY